MTTQSVMTQAANSFGGVRGSVSSKSRQAGSGFEALFNGSMKTGRAAASDKTENLSGIKNAVSDKDTGDYSGKPDANTAKNDKAPAADDKAADVNASSKETSAAGTGSLKQAAAKDGKVSADGQQAADPAADEAVSADQQQIASLLELLNQVQEILMQMLNLTPEQFSQLMDKLQTGNEAFSQAQFLQPDTIRQIVLFNSGITDPLAVLTNENLADTMKQILNAVEQLKSDAELPFNLEEMKKLLEQLKAGAEEKTGSKDNQDTSGIPADNMAGKEAQTAQVIK